MVKGQTAHPHTQTPTFEETTNCSKYRWPFPTRNNFTFQKIYIVSSTVVRNPRCNFVPGVCNLVLSEYKTLTSLNSTSPSLLRVLQVFHWACSHILGARCGAVGWSTALPAGRSRVRFPMVSLTQSFRSQYGPGFDCVSNRNEYQAYFLGVKAAGAWRWQPYHIQLDNLLEPSEPVQACNRIALPYGNILGLSFMSYYIFSHFHCAAFVFLYICIKEVTSVLPFVGRFDIPDIAEWI
jgi:hypothetical protein